MKVRVADTFSDSLAKLTVDEQKAAAPTRCAAGADFSTPDGPIRPSSGAQNP